MKEQSILLALRYQLATLGYSELVIDQQDAAILNFAKLLIASADIVSQPKWTKTKPARIESDDTYKYYMYINNPDACMWLEEMYPDKPEWIDSYRKSIKGFIFDTFESDCDWDTALEYNGIVDAYCDQSENEYVNLDLSK